MTILPFKLTLGEGVLAAAPGGDPNAENSLPYIPGSVLRGALIARYLQNGGQADDTDFRRLFLRDQVRFLNAYPLGNEGQVRMLPMPKCWVREKDPDQQAGETDETYEQRQRQVFDSRISDPPDPNKGVPGAFMWLDSNIIHTRSPGYEIAIHTARDRERGRAVPDNPNSALYRYQALASGQQFAGIIHLRNAQDADLLRPLLDKGELLLGGSTSAGYGLTEIAPWNDKKGTAAEVAILAQTPFTVYLASDAILRDADGRFGPYLVETLARQWNTNLTVEKAFSRMTWVGGFNATWGLPLPQSWAVQMGSVWVLTSDQPISLKEVEKVVNAGIGDRCTEGFGELHINPGWPDNLYLVDPDKKKKKRIPSPDSVKLTSQEAKLLKQMNERLARQEIDRQLVYKASEFARRYRGRLSNSQIARLRLRIRHELTSKKPAFQDFQNYLTGTEKRKSTDEQFRKSRIGNKNIREWLKDLTQEPAGIWARLGLSESEGEWGPATGPRQKIFLGATPYVLDSTLAHEYTIRLIEAVLTQISKSKGGRDGK
ncbi:MAG: hypothetical protein KC418_18680 [Anaerolineales bacterium]|nr:hypothetical protein [Anaerolineales bacterium]